MADITFTDNINETHQQFNNAVASQGVLLKFKHEQMSNVCVLRQFNIWQGSRCFQQLTEAPADYDCLVSIHVRMIGGQLEAVLRDLCRVGVDVTAAQHTLQRCESERLCTSPNTSGNVRNHMAGVSCNNAAHMAGSTEI
jgi:hypothetical protein